jgi:hypothetical protein
LTIPASFRRVKKPTPSSIPIGFPHARYYTEWDLITWHPYGVLDDKLVDEVVAFTQTQEQVATAPPFNRFTDFSGLTKVRLQIGHVFKVAKERSAAHRDLPPVKSAFYCDKLVGLGMARMIEALMKGSSIHVRAFRDRAAAAKWLGVPVENLSDDDRRLP